MLRMACCLIIYALFAFTAAHRQQLDERKSCWDPDPGQDPGDVPCYSQPEQVHLSYAGPNSLWVTWITFDDTGESLVKYGIDKLDTESRGNVDFFGGHGSKVRYDHRVRLDNLEPGKRYSYRVGSKAGWSAIYSFVALAPRPEGGYKFAFYGDMGSSNAKSLGKIQQEAQDGVIDMILHVGDFAYNMETDNGDVGDEFMRQIEPAAAYVPYMTVVGNHERAYDFQHYTNRFTMPGTSENMFYSFDLGHAHFIGFSTEFYFPDDLPYMKNLTEQWNWLKNDLHKANRNRDSVPWIITMGHRPMYCTREQNDKEDCSQSEGVTRTGINGAYGLEELFYEQGVDLELWAHEHSYQRLYPVYNRTVFNVTEHPYEDPPAPVHIIAGSAGCREQTDEFQPDNSPWLAFKSAEYGFSHIHVINETHIHIVQKDAMNETVVDDFMLVKHSHGPYTAEDLERLQEFGTYIGVN